MFTFHEKDNHKFPNPAKMHLPIPPDVANSQIFDLPDMRISDPDPSLLKLPAPGLHGTFAKAYNLLTKINSKIGWDALLKARSHVFVMEEVISSSPYPANLGISCRKGKTRRVSVVSYREWCSYRHG
jgi:Chs5-Arf1p-binding protein BUD7/BCH1